MDAGTIEYERQTLHGLVRRLPVPEGFGMVAIAVAACLLAALAGGLLRLGVALPVAAAWPAHAAVAHAALMIAGFFAAVIGIERAVAVKQRWAFAAPTLSAFSGLAILAGRHELAAVFAVGGSLAFVGVNAWVVRKQPVLHTWVLLAGASSLLAANLLHASGVAPAAVVSLWFAFLVVTIAAERLEMTRLMRHRPGAQGSLLALLATLLVAGLAAGAAPAPAGVAYGLALLLLALWLARFDVARRTLHARGLPRYMAVCLLAGYFWLAVAGAAWAATSAGLPWRDTALHALGLGFVFSMIMGHAPVILPAVARVKVAFTPLFYIPLFALHASVAWRVATSGDTRLHTWSGTLHLLALAGFAAVLAWGAAQWRASRRDPPLVGGGHDPVKP